jgi:MAF protein
MEKLVLASQSPRRQALLTQMGLTNFEVDFIPIDETIKPGELPENYVLRMAREKAKAVARIHPDDTVIAADTAVVLDGQIFGKPEDKDMAAEMLFALSGRWHEVMTGLTVISGNREQTVLEKVQDFVSRADAFGNRGVYCHRRAHGQGGCLRHSGAGGCACAPH